VWLVGMMGAGKSAVGSLLARRLGRRFYDTDEEIERSTGRSIAETFARDGEAAFRDLECKTVQGLSEETAAVALGSGAICQRATREAVVKAGTLIYLRARPESLLARRIEAGGDPERA
jgi:shikimate kinase